MAISPRRTAKRSLAAGRAAVASEVDRASSTRPAHYTIAVRMFFDGLTKGKARRYLTSMRTTVSSKGQIVLPAEIRKQDRIETGQEFEIERLDRGEYRLRRRSTALNEGMVDWLLSCPHKGFFVPIESEST